MANTPAPAAAPAAAPAPAPAATEEESYAFETVAVPAATRASVLVNPFDAVVKALAESMKGGEKSAEAKTVTVDTPKAAKVKRQLADAGKTHNVTVRSIPKESGDKTTLTFWTVKRITHSR